MQKDDHTNVVGKIFPLNKDAHGQFRPAISAWRRKKKTERGAEAFARLPLTAATP